MYQKIFLNFLMSFGLFFITFASEAQTTSWTTCALEDKICTFSGTREIRYGAGTKWVSKILTSSTPCTNAVFGDPIPGTGKSCQYSNTLAPAPVTWTNCAVENATCSFSGTREVRYGAGTKWVSKTLSTSTPCTNAVFGDPIPGYLKSCQYSSVVVADPTPTPTPTPIPDPSITWTVCASENGTCSFTGTREVRYGAGTKWSSKTLNTSTPCTNAVFGDPIPGYLKSCQYSSVVVADPTPTPTPTPTPPTPPVNTGAKITDLSIENTSSSDQANVPFTFGQAFVKGNLLATEGVAGQLADGSVIPLQVDVKALHTDGSVRHAIISGILPSLSANTERKINLLKVASANNGTATDPSALAAKGISAVVTVKVNGTSYQANLSNLLSSGKVSNWLSGATATEYLVSSPLKASTGEIHPSLTARFAVRYYPVINKAKIDVIMENGWTYETDVRDYMYDININVSGANAYAKTSLTHFSRARWHKNFWTSADPQVHIKHNVPYLISTKAIPNYEQGLNFSETTLNALRDDFNKSNHGPMGTGLAVAYMPTTGGRGDIGLHPSWHVLALLSMDKRAKEVSVGMGDAGASFSVHMRDKVTDQPTSIIDYPHMTTVPGTYADYNDVAKRSELIPACSTSTECNNPNIPDTAHQPAFNYIPYLLTGEHFQLEELMFYGMWNVGHASPAYREYDKGLVKEDQVRAQAWSLRTLVYNAYILPDSHRLKSHFKKIVDENIKSYNANYTNNPAANFLGMIDGGYATGYNGGRGMAPWQDDFFTSAIGVAAEMEMPGAFELLKWKAKFSVGRMAAPGVCWIMGANYSMNVKDDANSPLYTSFAQMYKASNSAALQATACASAEMAQVIATDTGEILPAGAIAGYPTSTVGLASDMTPALAFAKDSGISFGTEAWNYLMSSKLRPDYSTSPQFDIIPRSK